MVNIVGIRFQNAGKLYFFDPADQWPTPGDYVVVETSRGMELGEVVTGVHEIEEDQLTAPLKPVIRVATAADVQHDRDNRNAERQAYEVCQKKIAEHRLDMKLVSVTYTFDNSKILFYFTANGRVDFRSLVKDLASVFHTRIELRQIGVRDEAKMLGGLGPCGRPICCGTFLGDFQPVSIKMAKEQNLSLNPTKISGICGRLMCCLKFEQDNYEQTRKRMPRIGKEIKTPDGTGTVSDLNIIREQVTVRIAKGDAFENKVYALEEIRELNALPDAKPAKPQEQAQPQERERRRPKPVQRVKAEGKENSTETSAKPESEHRKAPDKQTNNASAAQDKPEKTEKKENPVSTAQPQPKTSSWRAALDEAMKSAKGE